MADEVQVSDQRLRGFFIVDNDVFSNKRKLSAYALLTYCVLARLATGKTGEITATRAYIAAVARIATGSVTKAINELAKEGLVAVEYRREGQKKLASRYTLNPVESCPSSGDGHTMTVTTRPCSKDVLQSKDVLGEKPKAQESLPPSSPARVYDLPTYVTPAAWSAFVEMRNRQRRPLTDRARDLLLRKLGRFEQSGWSPDEALDQSTVNCWQDVYPPRGDEGRNGKNGNNKIAQTAENLRAALRGQAEDHDRAGGDGSVPGDGAASGLLAGLLQAPRTRVPAGSAGVAAASGRDAPSRGRDRAA